MKLILISFLLLVAIYAQAQELFQMPKAISSHMSSFENKKAEKGNGGKTNQGVKGNAFEPLHAGSSKTLLDIKGAGIIQRMWFTIHDRTPEALRSVRIQIYWDGALKPAVDVPFGDFFGIGLGLNDKIAFENALFSSPEGRSFNCIIPMPFKTAAKFVITNESSKDMRWLFYDIDFVKVKSQPADMLYFHCYWHRQKTSSLGSDYEFLPKVFGQGRFLGVNAGINADHSYKDSWFGEGEVKMYVDGDSKYPTINGTGTEDYIGTGWGQKVFINRYQGCSVADVATEQYCFYRFHIPDQVVFQKEIKVTIQQLGGAFLDTIKKFVQNGANIRPISVDSRKLGFIGLLDNKLPPVTDPAFPNDGWVNFQRVDDWSSTAYFYLNKPESNLPVLQPVAERVK